MILKIHKVYSLQGLQLLFGSIREKKIIVDIFMILELVVPHIRARARVRVRRIYTVNL
jgi:hypothetical protein